MRRDTPLTEAGEQYATAHSAHYKTKDLQGALRLYQAVMATHTDTQEAEYSRTQIQNIVKSVVPKQTLLDAQVELILTHLEHEGLTELEPVPVTPLDSALSG